MKIYLTMRSPKHMEIILSYLKIGKDGRIRDTFYQYGRGYGQFCYILEKQAYPLCKLINTFFETCSPSVFKYITSPHRLRKNDSKQSRYNNLGLILGGIGLVTALCDSSDFTRGKILYGT